MSEFTPGLPFKAEAEIWKPTLRIRWLMRETNVTVGVVTAQHLQQAWSRPDGQYEWRDVEVVTE